MKILRISGGRKPGKRAQNGGFAILAVLVFLVLVLALVIHNAATLNHLGQELDLIEKKQMRKWSAPARPAEAEKIKGSDSQEPAPATPSAPPQNP
jgi:hypothetical protein